MARRFPDIAMEITDPPHTLAMHRNDGSARASWLNFTGELMLSLSSLLGGSSRGRGGRRRVKKGKERNKKTRHLGDKSLFPAAATRSPERPYP